MTLPRLLLSFVLVTGVFAIAPQSISAEDPGYVYWGDGKVVDARPATESAQFLVGGAMSGENKGPMEDAMRWFARKGGRGNLLIMGASNAPETKDSPTARWFAELAVFASVETIIFHHPRAVSDPRVLEILSRADAVFLLGGDQSRYITLWKDTPVAAALNAHIAAGKPIGGTSAGLAVLGEFYYSAMLDSVTSDRTLKDPFDPNITLGTDFLRIPALAGVITDTHFMPRNRLGRLITFLARLQLEHPAAPRLVGLGVDEGTAVCVEPDATARIYTVKNGSAWLVQLLASPRATVAAGNPLEARAVVVGLGPDSTLDLNTLEVTSPAALRTIRAGGGRITPDSRD